MELLLRPRDHDGKCVGIVIVVLVVVVVPALRSLRWLDEKECHRDVFSEAPMAEDCICFR